MTSSLNPNGVGLDSNPAFLMGRPKFEAPPPPAGAATGAAGQDTGAVNKPLPSQPTQVNLAQGSGQCYTTLKTNN